MDEQNKDFLKEIEQPLVPDPDPDFDGEEEARRDEEEKRKRFRAGAISWAKTLVAAFVIALLINSFIVVNAQVQSGSMEDTIMTHDRVMCNRLAYLFKDPQRFDIIVFDFTEDSGKTVKYVKRIIGLPGETVELIDGKVYINGSDTPLRDDFIIGEPEHNAGPFQVPEGCYFVLGDNRENSYDSKGWPDPYLEKGAILGKAMFSYYPKFYWVEHIE